MKFGANRFFQLLTDHLIVIFNLSRRKANLEIDPLAGSWRNADYDILN